MKTKVIAIFFMAIASFLRAQVGINTEAPSTTLQINGKDVANKVEGILIPRFTGDEIYNMPIASTTTNESNLVYATSAASTTNQTGRGINLKGKGFYYWNGTVWTTMVSTTTNNNYYSAHIKPMNVLLNDSDTYPAGVTGILSPSANQLKQFRCNYSAAETLQSNPLGNPAGSFVIWDNTDNKINIPAQLLGYTIAINISLKYPKNTSNAASTRFAAYTGDAVVNSSYIYQSGGIKLKDLFFKISKASDGPAYVRDELVLAPIVVTQHMIDNGIKLFLGFSDETFYEPVLTIDFGMVDDTL